MGAPIFLTIDDILFMHRRELEQAGGESGVRDFGLVESATFSPQASFAGEWLHKDLFEMAGTYLVSFVQNHPFLDGNKRTGTAAALTFLYVNGFIIEENHSEELAEKVLAFVLHNIEREELVTYLRSPSHKR